MTENCDCNNAGGATPGHSRLFSRTKYSLGLMTDTGRDLLFNDLVCGTGRNVLCLKKMKSRICGCVKVSRRDTQDLSHIHMVRSSRAKWDTGFFVVRWLDFVGKWLLFEQWLNVRAGDVLKSTQFRFPRGHVYFKEWSSVLQPTRLLSTSLQALPILPGYEVTEGREQRMGRGHRTLLPGIVCLPVFSSWSKHNRESRLPQTIGFC